MEKTIFAFRILPQVGAKQFKNLVGKDPLRPDRHMVKVSSRERKIGATDAHMMGLYDIEVVRQPTGDVDVNLPPDLFDTAKYAVPAAFSSKILGDHKLTRNYVYEVELLEDDKADDKADDKLNVVVYLDFQQDDFNRVEVYRMANLPNDIKLTVTMMLAVVPTETAGVEAIGFAPKLMAKLMGAMPGGEDSEWHGCKMNLSAPNKAITFDIVSVDFGYAARLLLMPKLI